MKFADLLFSRYANPQILLNQLISCGDFYDWILEFINSENEKEAWEVWLHKVYNQSFSDFKNSVEPKSEIVTIEQIETTVKSSKNILNSFIPQK